MRSTVISLRLLIVLIAIVSIAVHGARVSSVSNTSTTKPDDRSIVVCNAVQDSHCNEAMKSLEATLLAAME